MNTEVTIVMLLHVYFVVKHVFFPFVQTKFQKWYEELVTFIGQSKREVELQAHILIDSVKKWQHKTQKYFDVIQQKMIRERCEHNLESASSTSGENSAELIAQSPIEPLSVQSSMEAIAKRTTKRTVSKEEKNVCYPSMPSMLKYIKNIFLFLWFWWVFFSFSLVDRNRIWP